MGYLSGDRCGQAKAAGLGRDHQWRPGPRAYTSTQVGIDADPEPPDAARSRTRGRRRQAPAHWARSPAVDHAQLTAASETSLLHSHVAVRGDSARRCLERAPVAAGASPLAAQPPLLRSSRLRKATAVSTKRSTVAGLQWRPEMTCLACESRTTSRVACGITPRLRCVTRKSHTGSSGHANASTGARTLAMLTLASTVM